jgi:predicted Ser/Thr protein kinase
MDPIGRYEILGEIGRGGFGVVYRAQDPVMRRNVAIKVLTSVSDPALLARFRSEAGTTGNLRHKNIITVYDFGEHDGQPFLVMELLEGRSLQEAIKNGPPLSLFEKVSVMLQVAEGLRFAHERGVVHRDVKPSNVMLLNDGGAKILDFGIARFLDSTRTRHTMQGFIFGTIEYLSPDQLQGVDADPLTDIFSFGVICYELLSGNQPFRAETISRIMYLVATADPTPLSEVVPGCPEALQNVVRTALAKDRAKRYHSVQEMLFDLAPIEAALRKERAMELAAEAGRLVGIGDIDSAQASLNRVLELDPACEKGQELRREMQKRRERRELLRQAEALAGAGEERLTAKSFDEAIEAFQIALRMLPADAGPMREDVERRIFAASQARETAGRVAALVAEAREAAGRGEFPEALRLAAEAAAVDPSAADLAESARRLEAEIRQLEAEAERQRQESLQREETISSVTLAVRGHVDAKRYTEALRVVEGALSQYPGDQVLQKVRAAALEARRRYAEELEAERRQAVERQRQAEERLRMLETLPGEVRIRAPEPQAGEVSEGKSTGPPVLERGGTSRYIREFGNAPPEAPPRMPARPALRPSQWPPVLDRARPGLALSAARNRLVALWRSLPAMTRNRALTPPFARRFLTSGMAAVQGRLGRLTLILAATGLLALVLGIWLSPQRKQAEEAQQPELANLQDAIPAAIAARQWSQAGEDIARFDEIAPGDPRVAEWRKQVDAGVAYDRNLDDLRSSIRNAIREKDWATAERQVASLLAVAPDDPQAAGWRAQVAAQGRQPDLAAKQNSKREDDQRKREEDLQRAEQLLEQAKYPEAIELFQAVRKQDPGDARARSGLQRARNAKAAEDSVLNGGR